MKNFLWCPLVYSLPLGIVGVTPLSYIPAMFLKMSIMSPLRRLNTNVGRPILLDVPNIPDVSGQALALWLSFVPFLIRLYLSSYMAPVQLLMSRWVIVLDFQKVEEI